MKILITGGSGFIGTNLVEHYLQQDCQVLNIDTAEPRDPEHLGCWVQCDITDREALAKAVADFRPDYIVHLAARTDLEGKSLQDYDANVAGVENMLKAAATLPELKKILITSSMLVCHTGYIPKDQHDYCPVNFYGKSKVETERITWANPPACDWAILRPTSIWGPWFGVPYRNFFDMVKARRYFHIGHKSCTKTYGFVGNAVYQIDQILRHETTDTANKVFYIGDNPPIFIEEWADQIAAQLGQKVRRVPYPLIRLAAWGGDILHCLHVPFPMTSFRLRNMTTNNVIPLDNTYAVAPHPPVDRIAAIKHTLLWMEAIE